MNTPNSYLKSLGYLLTSLGGSSRGLKLSSLLGYYINERPYIDYP